MESEGKNKKGSGTRTGIAIGIGIGIAAVGIGVGIFFFGSLFQTNTENEAIQVSNAHNWAGSNATGTPNPDSVMALVVQNTGGKDVSIQSITVRGQSVPTSSWYYNNDPAVARSSNTQRELVWETNPNLNDGYSLDGSAGQEPLIRALGPISIAQGQSAFIVIDSPANISSLDTGLAFTVNVQAGKSSAVQSVSVVNAS